MQINTEKNRREIKEHGDFRFPVNVSMESIQSFEQGMFLWHWHPEIELTWVLSGEIEYRVNDAVFHLHAGEGLFGNSNTLHTGTAVRDSGCSYLSVTFHPRFLYGYEGSILQTKYIDYIIRNEEWSALKLEPSVDWQEDILKKIRKIWETSLKAGTCRMEHADLSDWVRHAGLSLNGLPEKKETDPDPADSDSECELEIQICLLEIWQLLFRYFHHCPVNQAKNRKSLDRLREMMRYLEENAAGEISLEEIASHVGLCRSECCRYFKKHMNMTIFEYLLFLRIQNSLPLLRQGMSVTQTAEMTGFSNPAYFGQIFRRYMKCTPKEYRKKNM